jgi:hypothetical protein
MTCTFFGHRDTPYIVFEQLKTSIINMIEKNNVERFYVGNNGNFDIMAQKALEEISIKRNDFDYLIVLSRINEIARGGNQNKTIFPEELAEVLPKFAIVKRNNWLICNSSYVIAYSKYPSSNANKLIKKSMKKGLIVENLADK